MAGIVGVRYDEISIEPMFDAFLGALAQRVRGPPVDAAEENIQARHPRHAADGAVEQVRLDRADHRQQVGDGGRLRDALRRHGRRLRGAEGHQQDARLPALRTTATASAASFPSGSSRGRRRRSCARTRPTRTRCRPTTCSTRSSKPTSSRTAARPKSSRRAFAPDAVAQGRAPHQDQRIQAAAGGGGHPHHAARLRQGLALSDHVGMERVGKRRRRARRGQRAVDARIVYACRRSRRSRAWEVRR